MEEKRFAVLIDSENISARYISSILDEMTKYGVVTYKRIYGDWTSAQTTRWKKELLENSIMPIQQFSNTCLLYTSLGGIGWTGFAAGKRASSRELGENRQEKRAGGTCSRSFCACCKKGVNPSFRSSRAGAC